MLQGLKAEWQRFKRVMKDDRGFLESLLPLAISAGASYFGSKNSSKNQSSSDDSGSGYELYDDRYPEQKAISEKLASLLQNGLAAYNKPRVAGLDSNEAYGINYLKKALETAAPGIDRLLSGEFPEEYFNQAIADPTRRQFETRVAPAMRENSELTGNRFADRSAIEMGQARGDIESSILSERGKLGLETYNSPMTTLSSLTSTLQGAENLFSVPRTIEQAQLDADFNEFLRTNPDAGGLIDAMMSFTGRAGMSTYVPQQEESLLPSLLSAGTSLLSSNNLTNALNGSSSSSGSSTGSATSSTVERLTNSAKLANWFNQNSGSQSWF